MSILDDFDQGSCQMGDCKVEKILLALERAVEQRDVWASAATSPHEVHPRDEKTRQEEDAELRAILDDGGVASL